MANSSKYERNSRDDDFTFEIVESVTTLGDTKPSGYTKELNFVSFKGAEPKWDLREWNSDHTRMSKGITLTDAEIRDLLAASPQVMERIEGAKGGTGATGGGTKEENNEGKEEATA